MANQPGEVRLTRSQAGKIWDRAFAATWPEIHSGHPSRSALERFVRAGWGGEDVRRFVATGELDPTVGMPRGARYQQVAEGTTQGLTPDYAQQSRMHEVAVQTGQPVAGSF